MWFLKLLLATTGAAGFAPAAAPVALTWSLVPWAMRPTVGTPAGFLTGRRGVPLPSGAR